MYIYKNIYCAKRKRYHIAYNYSFYSCSSGAKCSTLLQKLYKKWIFTIQIFPLALKTLQFYL